MEQREAEKERQRQCMKKLCDIRTMGEEGMSSSTSQFDLPNEHNVPNAIE